MACVLIIGLACVCVSKLFDMTKLFAKNIQRKCFFLCVNSLCLYFFVLNTGAKLDYFFYVTKTFLEKHYFVAF